MTYDMHWALNSTGYLGGVCVRGVHFGRQQILETNLLHVYIDPIAMYVSYAGMQQ